MSKQSYEIGLFLGRHKSATALVATVILSCLLWQSAQTAQPALPAAGVKPLVTHTPVEQTPKERSDDELNIVLNVALTLKNAVKNPASFELVSASYTAKHVVCIEYRATNSFNAVVPGNYVSLFGIGSAKARDWNKYCAHQNVTDYSNVRYFLK